MNWESYSFSRLSLFVDSENALRLESGRDTLVARNTLNPPDHCKMVTIRPIQTGPVQVKTAQRRRKAGGLVRILMDKNWTEWLPIYAWVIDHPEGVIVVDTGDTARTAEPGYFPSWHPYYRTSVRMDISPEEEIGPQLRELGIQPADVKTLVLTHFHTDHAGGLHHFPQSDILVEAGDYKAAQGLTGRVQGFLPNRWPEWFSPSPIPFRDDAVGPFETSYPITDAGDVIIVPTPGHTPGHVSVIVRIDGISYFLAGDTSYTQDLLLEREPDGVSPNKKVTMRTLDAIRNYARSFPTVYLPSHDPGSMRRLKQQSTLIPASVASA